MLPSICRLDPKTASMDSSSKSYVQALFNRLEQIHNQMMGYVETAEREHILVFRPFAFDQFDIESFILEETILDCAENRRFACDPDVSDTDFRGIPSVHSRPCLGFIATHGKEHDT